MLKKKYVAWLHCITECFLILLGFLFIYLLIFLFPQLFSAEPLGGTAAGKLIVFFCFLSCKNAKLFHHLLIRKAIFFCLGRGDTLCEFSNFINSQQAAPHDNDDNSGTAAESQSNNQRESVSVQIKPRRRCSACTLPPRKNVGIVNGEAVFTSSPLAARFLGSSIFTRVHFSKAEK